MAAMMVEPTNLVAVMAAQLANRIQMGFLMAESLALLTKMVPSLVASLAVRKVEMWANQKWKDSSRAGY